jgi:threonine dehydrogenase-like Zn-dependent dehydrogenase
MNRRLVLENDVIFGSVNANRSHYEAVAHVLAGRDHGWLSRLITRRLPLDAWSDAFSRQADDVKVVIEFARS